MPILRVNDFSGGLNTFQAQNLIADNQSPALRNCRWNRSGGLNKRLGTLRYTIPGASMTNDNTGLIAAAAYRFNPMGGATDPSSDQVLIASATEVVRSTDLSTFTSVFTGMTSQERFIHFIVLNNKVYIFNDTSDSVRTIDNTNGTSTVAAIPNGRYPIYHKGYLFVWGNSNTNLNRLAWSSLNTPETWPATNLETLDANDGNSAAGGISFRDELLLFKTPSVAGGYQRTKLYRVLGSVFDPTNPTYEIETIPLPENLSLLDGKTVRVFNGGVMFMTNLGFYFYEGGGRTPVRVSDQLGYNTNFERINGNVGRSAIVFNDNYYCSSGQEVQTYQGITLANYRVFVIDKNFKVVQDYVDPGSDSNIGSTTGGGAARDWFLLNSDLYSLSPVSAADGDPPHLVRRYQIGPPQASPESPIFTDNQDDNTTGYINLSYTTKEFDFGKEVDFKYCYVHLKRQSSGTMTFGVNVNQRGENTSSIDMTTPDTGTAENSSSNILKKQVNIGRMGRTIQFRVHDRGDNDVEIYSIELHYADTENYS